MQEDTEDFHEWGSYLVQTVLKKFIKYLKKLRIPRKSTRAYAAAQQFTRIMYSILQEFLAQEIRDALPYEYSDDTFQFQKGSYVIISIEENEFDNADSNLDRATMSLLSSFAIFWKNLLLDEVRRRLLNFQCPCGGAYYKKVVKGIRQDTQLIIFSLEQQLMQKAKEQEDRAHRQLPIGLQK